MKPNPIDAARVRYIKLGEGGDWTEDCVLNGDLRIGFWTDQAFDNCLQGNWAAVRAFFSSQGRTPAVVSRFLYEVQCVFNDEGKTLWITFDDFKMHWGFIDTSVPPQRAPEGNEGCFRKMLGGWRSADVNGDVLRKESLSGNLTKTASYRGTSCDIKDVRYVIDRINGKRPPEVAEAARLTQEFEVQLIAMMRRLHPKDFELLIDLMFTSSGWKRLGPLGGTQKTVDALMILPTTGEHAFVQVKSNTTQGEFDKYRETFLTSGHAKMFYVHHSGEVKCGDPGVVLLGPQKLAQIIIECGLVFWLMKKVS